MRKAILFLLATMMMASCAEQQIFDDVALDAPTQATKTDNFDDLMAQARWGDGNAYLKLADYYTNGDNGAKLDIMTTASLLSMAREYGAVSSPSEYFSKFPEDNPTRMAYEAMEDFDQLKKEEEGLLLADRLISSGFADGYAIKGFHAMETGDTIEAVRLATIAAEQGSSLGKVMQYVIPYGQMADMPDESAMIPVAEAVPIFYQFMAEEYNRHLAQHPENDEKVARCYLKADEKGLLDRRGADWLLSYMECGNDLPLSETDIIRLMKLAGYEREEFPTDEYEDMEDDLWEEPVNSISIDIEAMEVAVKAVEEAKEQVEKDKLNNEE